MFRAGGLAPATSILKKGPELSEDFRSEFCQELVCPGCEIERMRILTIGIFQG